MEKKFCLGICPYCDGNGLLLAVKDDKTGRIFVSCDEAYHEFDTPEDAINKKISAIPMMTFNDVSITLEESINNGWADYIYVLENGKWLKYTDKTKVLF